MNKKSQPVQRFLPVKEYVGGPFLLYFLEYIAPSIIYHRTLLTLYQNFKTSFFDHLDCEYINIDFTENLTIDIKWEPQSLHWSKKQVTVHSGAVKTIKTIVYYPHISNSRMHD